MGQVVGVGVAETAKTVDIKSDTGAEKIRGVFCRGQKKKFA
jgi:GTP cyclohydrolase III